MISQAYANKILGTLIGYGAADAYETKYKLLSDGAYSLYMGLCYKKPDESDGAVTTEPKEWNASTKTGEYYSRIQVSRILSTPVTNSTKYTETVDYIYFTEPEDGVIKNNTEIKFPTARNGYIPDGYSIDDINSDTPPDECKIKYFFLSTSSTRGSVAIMWGKVYDKDGNWGIVVKPETVPAFYEEELQISIDVPLPVDDEAATE